MGKKLVGVIAFAAIAAVAGWNYQQNQRSVEQLSDLALANVEALANGEAKPGDPCYKTYNSSLPEATKCASPCTKERCGGTIDKCY